MPVKSGLVHPGWQQPDGLHGEIETLSIFGSETDLGGALVLGEHNSLWYRHGPLSTPPPVNPPANFAPAPISVDPWAFRVASTAWIANTESNVFQWKWS
jgi:hypothetical protein